MKLKILLFLLLLLTFFSFNFKKNIIQNNTIQSRFKVPDGFVRTKEAVNSFGNHLRNLPLKPIGSQVKYFNGSIKSKQNVYDAVVDLPIGNKDLHQCADAVMRLRADYFYQNKQYDINLTDK